MVYGDWVGVREMRRGSERLLCIAGRSWDVPLMMRLPPLLYNQ